MSTSEPEDPARPGEASRHARRRTTQWRVLALATFLAAGALFITSSVDSRAGTLRSSSVTDLGTLVRDQRRDTNAQQVRLVALSGQVTSLTRDVNDATVTRLQGQVDRAKGPAGLDPVSGAGITVTLMDAPSDVIEQAIAEGDPPAERLIVHQQDIQAVVNALWLGGARGISIMNQRIVSTTGIKCAGPAVILHGVPFSPPYKIRAVGDPGLLAAALGSSEYIAAYRSIADRYGLVYEEQLEDDLDLPGYTGTLDLRYARPLG